MTLTLAFHAPTLTLSALSNRHCAGPRTAFRAFASASGISSSHPASPSIADPVGTVIYTETDEAPALATYSLLPIFKKFGSLAKVQVTTSDISLAGRVLSEFHEKLSPEQQVLDNLSYLGEVAKTPGANIIKLPNISASIPQLMACIAELQGKGFDIPSFPQEPKNDEEKAIADRYAKVLGSAVNPVLREGNSDRRVADPVKRYAAKNPHKMGLWSKASRTHVAHMTKGDFYASEQSATMKAATDVRIELVKEDGNIQVLKDSTPLQEGEVIDAAFMDVAELNEFFESEMNEAKDSEILLSLHLKATMMKVSDPIMFGHCVKTFYKTAFEKHQALFDEIGANPNNGIGDIYDKVFEKCDAKTAVQVIHDVEECYKERPWLAMVNSHKGITNLHVPSDVIVDASMPVVVRDSGQMWNKDDELEDTKCLIPDRCYATMYQEILSFCKTHGQFDVSTMGNVANVGLMAQKAEEYGSHDKTFEVPEAGKIRVVDKNSGEQYFEHKVSQGDIWRMAQTKDEPIRDWVKLAVTRAKLTGSRTIFWLDSNRAHDAQLIEKVNAYLKDHDTSGADISIMRPIDAMRVSCERTVEGKNTISVTGNVLRDYLTDLFPILELGTSAKMLSIVPLLAGGGLFETGAGGSAPKHVQQFVEEGHLRWDSLGEYLATAVGFEHLGRNTGSEDALLLGETLNKAVGRVLDNRKSPSRRVNEIDNRATNFYVALYWAEYLAEANPSVYGDLYKQLSDARTQIVQEHIGVQGKPQDVGGYFKFDPDKADAVMRPSETMNKIIDSTGQKGEEVA